MNAPSPRHDPAIDEQAAYWAARLDGSVLEAAERTALDAWLAQSAAHRAALSDYCQFSADLEQQLPVLVSTGAVKMPAAAPRATRWWSLPKFATGLLVATAAIAAGLWFARPTPQIENLVAGIAQRSAHTLADGTRVELNGHTSLRFENSRTERRVRLAGGEALFAVAKDHARPFIIETPSGSVRVTGTTFNVRNDTGAAISLEVTVVEGSVEVRPGNLAAQTQPPFALTAGQQLVAGPAEVKVRTLSDSAVTDALAWREGRIVCVDMPLHEAAARFARYHGRRIVVHPDIASKPLGGSYGLDDLSAFLAAVEVALPVKANRDDSGVSLDPRPGSKL